MTNTEIDATGYTGLAKARIRTYNENLDDLAREVRLGRGDEEYAKTLSEKDIPESRMTAVKEMIAQDGRQGRTTSPDNLGQV